MEPSGSNCRASALAPGPGLVQAHDHALDGAAELSGALGSGSQHQGRHGVAVVADGGMEPLLDGNLGGGPAAAVLSRSASTGRW